jgi:hypothetical protein
LKHQSRHRQSLSLLALLLACFGFVLAASALEHTDDGCEVEVHCLPCRWHQGATVTFAAAPQPEAPVDLGSAHVEAQPRAPSDGGRSETPSRAPPLA